MKRSSKSSQDPPGLSIIRQFNPTRDNQHINNVRLVQGGSISSNGAGIVNQVLTLNPSGSSEWTSYSNIYDEFRVMAARVTLVPLQQGSVTSSNGLLAVVFDNDDSVALTSFTAALEYDTAKQLPAIWYDNQRGPRRFEWARPNAGVSTTIPWIDIAAPAGSNGSIKFYGTNLTVSTSYYAYSIEYFVQYRGRR